MKYGTEVGSDAVIYIPSFIKISLDIQQLFWGWEIDRHTGRMEMT
jgi:hypothetical protein